MQPNFFSQPLNASTSEDTTSTTHNRFEVSFSETIIKSKQVKTSMKSLKFSKSTTSTTNNTNTGTSNYQSPKTVPKKKLTSFRKRINPDEDIFEFKLLPLLFKILKIIDNLLYYVVFAICQLPLIILKVSVFLLGQMKRCFNWLKSQMKKPIKIPHFYWFRCFRPLILVLDLDETLVHCTKEKPVFECEELLVSMKGGKIERYFISKRPYLALFIEELSKFYTLAVFTSSQQEYADSVINHIDFKRTIKHRFYRKVTPYNPLTLLI